MKRLGERVVCVLVPRRIAIRHACEEAAVGDTRLVAWMRAVGVARQWSPGAMIFREGEPASSVLLIEQGRTKAVLRSSGGKQVLLAVRGPGELLGEFAALDGQARSASVQALTDVQGRLVGAESLVSHLASEPHAALELLRLLVGRLRESDMRRLDFGALDTVGRIASVLTGLVARHSRAGWLDLTQAELGESVGASREATVKALRRLREAGLLETARGRIRITDPVRLSALAEGEPLR